MADGFSIEFFDLASEKVKYLDEQLKKFSETSEASSKRINKALSKIGNVELDTSSIDGFIGYMEKVREKLVEIGKARKDNAGNESVISVLGKEAKGAVDEVNKITLALDKMRVASTVDSGKNLATLQKRYKKVVDELSVGGHYGGKSGKEFIPLKAAEVQMLADERDFLKQLIDERTMSSRRRLENAKNQAKIEKRIEDEKNDELVKSYKKTLAEIKKIAAEFHRVKMVESESGESDSTFLLKGKIQNRYKELADEKRTIEEKNLAEISKLREDFERGYKIKRIEDIRELEAARKKSEAKIRSEYGQINSEMSRLLDTYKKSEFLSGRIGGSDDSREKQNSILDRYEDLNKRKLEIEESFESSVSDLKEKYAAEEDRKSLMRDDSERSRRESDFKRDQAKWLADSRRAASDRRREINEARSEYKSVYNEIHENEKSLESARRARGKYNDFSVTDEEIVSTENRIADLYKRKAALEDRYGENLLKTRLEAESKFRRESIKSGEEISKANLNRVRSEYGQVRSEMNKVYNSWVKSIEVTQKIGKTANSDKNESELSSRYGELDKRRRQIEEEYERYVSDLRTKYDVEEDRRELERDNSIRAKKKSAEEKDSKERKRKIEEARADYKRVYEEIYNSQKSLNRAREGKEKFGDAYNADVDVEAVTQRINTLNDKKIRLEKEFGASLYKARMEVEAKINRDSIAQETNRAKKKKAEYESWLKTTEGATFFSDNVKSINEEKNAVKYLTEARDNLSRSTENYDKIVADLNKRIDSHRISIESKTKSQQQEQTLLPSIRNEYARLLKEIDSLRDSYSKLKDTEKSSGADLRSEKEAILARWKDVAIAKHNIEKDSQGQLDDIVRKHEAERAKANLDAFIRQEEEKARIAKKEAEERAKAQAEQEEEYNNSYEGSLSFSRMSKSAKDESEAIKYLKNARENLLITDDKYNEKLERLNGAIRRHERRLELISEKSKKVAGAHKGLMDISGQLARRLALVFSVSQITGYINKLASVRGEFELQKKALEAIVKDKDETDKLWNRTVELAVKSPFRVKELVTYTKQLAAYRVEAGKLYDTNKMLADVSAGLGVEMNRLILAYGQVKAANYLRGTELRQFSEAGVNILEELAKYFSEVEGRAIKVGDVFEMVSKRMVSFADVEEVFKRITSEGGTFFNMQEIQAETLKGQISNLYDSIDIMLNKIGEDNEGTLKGVVRATREMVENWEEVAFVIKKVVPAFLGINVASLLYNKGIKTAGTSTLWFSKTLTGMNNIWLGEATALDKATGKAMGWNRVQRIMIRTTAKVQAAIMGLWGVFKAFAPYLVVAGIVEVVRRYTEEERKLEELRKSMRKVINDDISSLEKEKNGYIDLINRMKSANKGTLERKTIIGRLNSEYGEYLNFVVKENTEVSKLSDAYDEVVKKMKNKAALNSLQKSYSTIEENYRNELQGAKDEFYQMFKEGTVKSTKSDKRFDFILPTKKEIDDIYILLQNKIRELKADELDSVKEQQDLLQSIIKGYYGKDYYLGVNYDDIKLMDILLDKKRQEEEVQKEINALYEETLPSREANLALEELQSKYIHKREKIEKDESTTVFEKNKLLSNLADMEKMDIIDIKVKFNIISEEKGEAQKKAIKEWEEETTKSINNAVKNIKGFSEEDLTRVLISKDDQTNQSLQEYIKKIKGGWEKQNEIIREQIGLKSQGLDADEESLKNAVKLEELYRKVADLLGIEIGYKEPVNKAVVDKINAAVSEKFQISELDALSSQDQLLSENNKELSEHIKKLEMLKNAKQYDSEGLNKGLDESIEKEQEYINMLTLKGQMLGSYNQKLIDQRTIESINAKLSEEYQIKDEDRLKSQKDLLAEAKSEMDDAIARQDMLNHAKAKGTEINEEEIKQIEEEVKFSTLKWKLLGGNDDEKEKKQRKAREVLEERLRVIKELHEAYKELNKTLSENEAKEGALQKYGDAFRAAYAGTSLKLDDFYTSEQGMKEFYTKLVAYARDAKDKIRVELAKGEIILEEKVKFKVESDNNLNEEIEKMFGDYDISLDLESLNVPTDVAKNLFGLDATSLKDIKSNLLSRRDEFIGSEQEEKYKEFLKRIEELEDKSRMERLKKFAGFLKSTTDEILLAQTGGAEDISFAKVLFDEGKISAEQYAEILKNVVREVNENVSKINLDRFKDSSDYIAAMGTLAGYTNKELDELKNRIENVFSVSAGNMSVEEVKAYQEAIDNIEKQKEDNSKFIDDTPLQNLREYLRLEKELTAEKERQKKLRDKKDDIKDKIEEEKTRLFVLKSTNAGGKNNEQIKASEENLKNLTEQSEQVDENLKKSASTVSTIGKKMKDFANGSTKAGLVVDTIVKQVYNSIGASVDMFNEIKDLAASFGADTENGKWKSAALGFQAIGEMNEKVMGSWNALKSGDIAGAVVQGTGAIFSLIKGFNAIHDNKREMKISKELKKIEKLEKEYEKLGEAIEKSYSISDLNKNMAESDDNIEKQIASREEMIRLEEDKKKTDKERIEQWNEEIEELRKRQEELHREQVEEMGGTYDYKSAAEEFVNAWLDAFQETGDGLQGLKDHFKDFAKELLLKQAVMRGAASIIQPLESMITDKLKDYKIDDSEWNEIDKEQEVRLQQLHEFLERFYGRYEGLFDESGSLGGLSESIQGITESTAQILEAYLNSVRLFVADTNSKFTHFTEMFVSDTENPMLSQLKIIAKQTDAIRRIFDGVVREGHPQGGAGIKVFMD